MKNRVKNLMRPIVFVVIAVAGWAAASGATAPATHLQNSQQTPIFRASASAVMVDVSVRDASRRVLKDLTAADFTVLDNGVTQQVDDVSYGKLPIDVTVGLDVSYSVTGPLLDQLRRAVTQLMRDLNKDDRLKLMLFNQRVTRTVDFTTDASQVERAMRAATAGGGTAVFDTLSVALISAAQPDRRQLIVFFTDGHDGTSTTSPATLAKVAERAQATVSFVMLRPVSTIGPTVTRPAGAVTITNNPPPLLGAVSPSVSVIMVNPVLQQLAADTGGSVLLASASTELGPSFLRALDTFRSAYVLYYSPKGVDRTGFHAISVMVNRPGAIIQARRGYFGG